MRFHFLNWKILDLSVGIIVGFTPSGFVPGGVAGAHVWGSTVIGCAGS
jgi:hypothetical protein